MPTLSSPHILILGSRIFAPITMIDHELRSLPADSSITAFGSSDVCARAVIAGTSLGFDARNVTLEPSRGSLIAAARQPGAQVWLFVATDPRTKQITEGMSQITAALSAEGIVVRQIASPLPGRVCEQVTKLRQAVDKTVAIAQPVRRGALVTRTLKIVTETLTLRDEYEAKLEAGMWLMPDDETATDRWLGWLRSYTVISDVVEDAKSVLVEVAA